MFNKYIKALFLSGLAASILCVSSAFNKYIKALFVSGLVASILCVSAAHADKLEFKDNDRVDGQKYWRAYHTLTVDTVSGFVKVDTSAKSSKITGFKSFTLAELRDAHGTTIAVLKWENYANAYTEKWKHFHVQIPADIASRVAGIYTKTYERDSGAFWDAVGGFAKDLIPLIPVVMAL